MHPTALADSGLGISQQDIAAMFDPFVERKVAADDPEWRRAIRQRKRKTLLKILRRWLLRHRRDEQNVVSEYSKAWRQIVYANYSLDQPPPRYSPWEWRGQRMLASTFGATRVRQLLLIRVLERVRPRRVLEVGCGNGINLLLLAGRFPKVEFAGIELTEEGQAAAVALQDLPELPPEMQAYAPEPLEDVSAFRRIRFLQGSAAQLPFTDGEIDLVFTVLSLEQMERIRQQALSEIARVARQHTLMIEPFADVNNSFWPRLNVVRRDYFRGRIGDLAGHGLHPIVVTDDFPQESFLKVCAVLAEKRLTTE
jgi:ubiquinone/menaquinone biosynthesis C-methylase UbiE